MTLRKKTVRKKLKETITYNNSKVRSAMIVCSCNVLSDAQVRETCARSDAPRSPGQVYQCLGCSPQCGRCARTIRTIMDEALGRGACEACPAVCPAAGTVPAE